jgi:hypothetical protein
MSAVFLLSDRVVRDDGQSEGWELGPLQGQPLLLTLRINRILQHQSLQASVWGSRDGKMWERLIAVPPKSYCGSYSLMLDLNQHPDVRFLRAHWTLGPGTASRVIFEISISVEKQAAKCAAAKTVGA